MVSFSIVSQGTMAADWTLIEGAKRCYGLAKQRHERKIAQVSPTIVSFSISPFVMASGRSNGLLLHELWLCGGLFGMVIFLGRTWYSGKKKV